MNVKSSVNHTIISKKKTTFKESSINAQISFILSFVVFLFFLLYCSLIDLYGTLVALYSIGFALIFIALVNTILGGLTFKCGKNIFGIIGFIISLLVVIFLIAFLSAISSIVLRPC